MNEAIKLAIEKGGYIGMNWSQLFNNKLLLLDPLFWQALGKALEWEERVIVGEGKQYWGRRWREDIAEVTWLYHWHRFIDSLAAGKDVNEFFKELLNEKD